MKQVRKIFINLAVMRMYFYIYVFSGILFLTSCHSVKDVRVSGIQNFKIKKINKEGIEAELSVIIQNPNSFGFYVYAGKAQVFLSNIPLGKARLIKKVYIPAQSSASYDLVLRTSFDKISMRDIMSNISLSGIGKVKIEGYVRVGKFLFRKKVPVHYEGSPRDFMNLNIGGD